MKFNRGIAAIALLSCTLAIHQGCASAESTVAKPATGSPNAQVAANSPLAGLPSSAGAHIEKIKALGDNQWLHLGLPAPDPKWGQPYGRDWGPHMPYAAEFGAAFFPPTSGSHGFVAPNGHFGDDFWAYDIHAHRWICIYPGSDTKSISLKMDANGFETDQDGQPIPVAQLGHAFEMVTYDTDRKKFMFMPCATDQFKPSLGARRDTWGGGYPWPYQPTQCSPWMYNVPTGKFELRKTQGPVPGSSWGDVLVYAPSVKKLFFLRTNGSFKSVWLYDPQANTWTDLKPKGPPPPFGLDASACLDLKRERIYFGGGYYPCVPQGSNALWCYEIKTNTWLDLKPKGAPCGGCNRFGPDHAVMNYDSVNDSVVLFYHLLPQGETDGPAPTAGAAALGIYVYDPTANAWTEKPMPFAKELAQSKYPLCYNSFYSAELNAHFMIAGSYTAADGTMWVYRYKQAKK